MALGGVLRDVLSGLASRGMLGPVQTGPATGYVFVYVLELILLFATIIVMAPLVRSPTEKLPA